MKKVLTVSVAAYNVEKFIHQTLNSCLCDEINDDIEILVVDDGAKDGTANIVRQYEEKYPNTIRLIHKENGGYGTTVNTSVRAAKGIFFKLLDGDDWFNTEGLKKLVNILKNTESDIVFNKMYKEFPDLEILENDNWDEYAGKEMLLSEVAAGVHAGMWEMTVRTEVLRKNWIDLPGKTLYTDHFYIMQALPETHKVLFLDFPVYCYRLGYAEQSVSLESRRKHVDEIVKVSALVSDYYSKYCKDTPNALYARERARFTYMEAHRALLLKKYGFKTMQEVKQFDKNLRTIEPDIWDVCENFGGKKSLVFMRRTGYLGYFLIVIKDRVLAKIRKSIKK